MFVVLFAYGIHIMQWYIYILMICKMLSLDKSLLPCSAISFSVPMFSHFLRAPKSCAPRKQTEPRKSRAVVGEVGRSQTRWLAPGSTNWAFPVARVNIEAITKGGKTYVCEKSWQPLIFSLLCHKLSFILKHEGLRSPIQLHLATPLEGCALKASWYVNMSD